MANKEKPLVSCLCLTRNRVSQLRKAIENFRGQTYPNKELLILFLSDDTMTKQFSSSIKEENIRWLEVPATPRMSLGNLRNLSIKLAAGEYFCQWDDDDWYHRERIEMQLNCLVDSRKSACILAYLFMYDAIEEVAYLSSVEPWAGSILCRKDILSETNRYPDLSLHEDTHFVWDCVTLKNSAPLIMPSLYIYVFHGRNTFERAHFQDHFGKGQALPAHVGKLFKEIVGNSIPYVDACRMLRDEYIMRELNFFHISRRKEANNSKSPIYEPDNYCGQYQP